MKYSLNVKIPSLLLLALLLAGCANQPGTLQDNVTAPVEKEIKEQPKEEVKPEAVKEEPAVSNETSTGLTLTGKQVAGGISLAWTVKDLDVSTGFKVVKSTETNPVYPGNDYQYLPSASQRSLTWKIADGKTYYFRVCQYSEGKCREYSNNLKLTAPKYVSPKKTEEKATSGAVTSISVSKVGGGTVKWSLNGKSEQGFKLVWSKNTSPAYPTREGDKYNYYSDAGARTGTIDAFDGSGSYYVRVCEYLGGRCGVYSNQIKLSLE